MKDCERRLIARLQAPTPHPKFRGIRSEGKRPLKQHKVRTGSGSNRVTRKTKSPSLTRSLRSRFCICRPTSTTWDRVRRTTNFPSLTRSPLPVLYLPTQEHHLGLTRRCRPRFCLQFVFFRVKTLQASTALAGSIATPPSSMWRMIPSLSITKVARFPKPCSSLKIP